MKKIFLFGAVIALGLASCEKPKKGCTDPDAINFDSAAEVNDGSCIYIDTIYSTDTLHTSCYKDSISKEIQVICPLNYGIEERRHLGYWLDHLQYTRETSHWARMFMVAVFDKNTLDPWNSQEHGDYGHINYGLFPTGKYIPEWNKYNFYFENNHAAGIDSLMSFVNDVPEGNYVLFYTFRGNNFKTWLDGKPISTDYENFLNSIGANTDSLKEYPNNFPYILLFKKGDSSTVQEEFYKEEEYSHKILFLFSTLTNF